MDPRSMSCERRNTLRHCGNCHKHLNTHETEYVCAIHAVHIVIKGESVRSSCSINLKLVIMANGKARKVPRVPLFHAFFGGGAKIAKEAKQARRANVNLHPMVLGQALRRHPFLHHITPFLRPHHLCFPTSWFWFLLLKQSPSQDFTFVPSPCASRNLFACCVDHSFHSFSHCLTAAHSTSHIASRLHSIRKCRLKQSTAISCLP